MLRDEEDAILSLGGFALEGLLTDLDPEAVSGLRAQLGLNHADIGYGREDLYDGKFADDDSGVTGRDISGRRNNDRVNEVVGSSVGKDWEDEVDQELFEEQSTLVSARRSTKYGKKVRGEIDDYDDEDDDDDEEEEEEEEEESLAADSPQNYRFKKQFNPNVTPRNRTLSPTHSSSHQAQSSPNVEMKQVQTERVHVHEIYPTFVENGVLEFTDLFALLPRKRPRISAGYVRIEYPDPLPAAVSTVELLDGSKNSIQDFSNPSKLPKMLEDAYRELIETMPPVESSSLESEQKIETLDDELDLKNYLNEQATEGITPWKLPLDERGWEALALQDWEDDIIWKPEDYQNSSCKPLDTLTRLSRPRNDIIEEGEWIRSVILHPHKRPWKDFTDLHLVEEDIRLHNEINQATNQSKNNLEMGASKNPSLSQAASNVRSRDGKQPEMDPYNLSNDRLYEVSKENRRRVRQTFGNLEVQHSYPAQKLQIPLYKTRLTKHEARSFHRPPLQLPVNIPIKFSKVKAAKKKKDKLGRKIRNTASASELLKSTTDLTLKDTGGFMLFEYSEEAPPIISNIGMGSIFVNYYRKKEPTDDFVPNDPLGEPFVLDVADESPFMKFGSIQPGETVPTLYNNLIRAPLFKHKPYSTDFLIIRSVTHAGTNYYIRSIENLFVVGQTYPVTEVPGPHSRKITTQFKHRLQTVAFKLCEKSPEGQVKMSKILKYFSDQSEMQMRQRLKEFMEYTRKGKNQGYWIIRPQIKIPDKDEIFKLVTPEGICLAESMQVGQRQLLDAGYGKDANLEGDGDDQSKLDIEQQLAPWSTTKNFIQATQNKAMLRLYGEGDPSGRGEGFSFIRVSMKEVFLRDGETIEDRQAEIAARNRNTLRYNSNEQQDIYKQEIERIWQSQRAALSDPIPPQLTQEDELRARGNRVPVGLTPSCAGDTPIPPYSAGVGTPVDWPLSRRSRSPSSFSRQSSPERDDGMSMGSRNNVVGANKALKIRRLIDGKWKTEVVRDPTIVNAYLRQRRLIDEQESSAEALMPSDDPEKNRLAKKRIEEALAKLKKNQERRLARKLAKENGMTYNSKKPSLVKTEVPFSSSTGSTSQIRKCGHCGQIGHMKTNRKCPRWAEFNPSS
ncbi:hypothetical protein BY996DRAFT_4607068 [Phakopsora pachyrhizi]|nr:hypothetical protein BY996DRAFT_4607068 [Phakopsora pachyrhizi]